MSDFQQRTGANGKPSAVDRTEEILGDLVEQLKDREFKALLEKYNEEFVAAVPTNELTDDALEAIEQATAANQLQRRCEYARKLSKAIMKRVSGSTDSELFKTPKKVLELLDEIEAGDKSRWRELDTATYSMVQLCRVECEKPAETERNAKRIISAILVSIVMILVFELFVYFGPITWLKNHPKSYGIQGSIICLIPCLIFGYFKPQWRNGCWWTAGLAFLVLILSLI